MDLPQLTCRHHSEAENSGAALDPVPCSVLGATAHSPVQGLPSQINMSERDLWRPSGPWVLFFTFCFDFHCSCYGVEAMKNKYLRHLSSPFPVSVLAASLPSCPLPWPVLDVNALLLAPAVARSHPPPPEHSSVWALWFSLHQMLQEDLTGSGSEKMF